MNGITNGVVAGDHCGRPVPVGQQVEHWNPLARPWIHFQRPAALGSPRHPTGYDLNCPLILATQCLSLRLQVERFYVEECKNDSVGYGSAAAV
jgi:hypothetical protein